MKLNYNNDYLSIKRFDAIEIEDFSVITGLNGSGKSHLLAAIDNGSVEIEGIEKEEVILYNYNDFNVFNLNLSKVNNSQNELFEKLKVFQNRSNSYSNKINAKRSKLLSKFNFNKEIENIQFNDDFQYDLPNSTSFLNWNREDYQDNITDYTHELINNIKDRYSFRVKDAQLFAEEYIEFIFKSRSLNFLRELDYLNLDDEELSLFRKASLNNTNSLILNSKQENKFGASLQNILDAIRMHTHDFSDYNFERFLEYNKNVYEELKKYFIEKIDEHTLDLYKKANPEKELLNRIEFGSGFFNLNEIEIEEKRYQVNKQQNEINEFQNSKGKNTKFYQDHDFERIFGKSPVSILNEILEKYDCNGYEFKQTILEIDLKTDINQKNINISLYNKQGDYETNLESLSSGERTLIALAFSIFKLRSNNIIAKVLLLDEVDSALHPSMAKRLIEVLHDYFYKELGLKLIISTHSPSTVAFSPENSLLVMRKDLVPRLVKVDKDMALKELTLGVPSFSINYENRRQIFVESQYDVEYYEKLYTIFKTELDSEISLNFIASGAVRKDLNGSPVNNCDTVINVTKVLREAGNKFVWGIIDWDFKTKRPKEDYIKVLGFNSRYSIENFLFDPLLIGFLLIREGVFSFDYFGLRKEYGLKELFSLIQDECQLIIDKVIVDFESKGFLEENNLVDYKTVGGFSLKISDFMLKVQGHELERLFREVYPKLNGLAKPGENHLKNVIIEKVINDFKEITPIELLDVVKSVQKI